MTPFALSEAQNIQLYYQGFLLYFVSMVSVCMVILVLCNYTTPSRIGVCYGFKVMTVTESPNTAFTVLFEHLRKGL